MTRFHGQVFSALITKTPFAGHDWQQTALSLIQLRHTWQHHAQALIEQKQTPPAFVRDLLDISSVQSFLKNQSPTTDWQLLSGFKPDMIEKVISDKTYAAFAPNAKGFSSRSIPPMPTQSAATASSTDPEVASMHQFFQVAFNGKKESKKTQQSENIFSVLLDCWQNPTEDKLEKLALLGRNTQGIVKIAYIRTLGRFKGIDKAVLKLLDFIRSEEKDEISAVLTALGDIDTPRSHLELIASLTRPNIALSSRLDICRMLKGAKLAQLQKELRAALTDLNLGAKQTDDEKELLDSIQSLLLPTSEKATPTSASPQVTFDDKSIDIALAKRFQHYQKQSSEVRRALRTAEFFYRQITDMKQANTIDLSPIIDMQYKALELIFRESFEDSCSRAVQDGSIQRKLDVIGYARPIPHAMDEFENYIAGLPTISAIPFFSKFKLRKMLRALCVFRPGKRFTLDGLKAFALFFLVFGRQQCKFGLQQMYHTGFKHDEQLFSFVRDLHVLQDIRNRAVHEGVPPNAGSDIEGVWRMTSDIMNLVELLKAADQPPKTHRRVS
jgi:hypothetical protein